MQRRRGARPRALDALEEDLSRPRARETPLDRVDLGDGNTTARATTATTTTTTTSPASATATKVGSATPSLLSGLLLLLRHRRQHEVDLVEDDASDIA